MWGQKPVSNEKFSKMKRGLGGESNVNELSYMGDQGKLDGLGQKCWKLVSAIDPNFW